MNEPERVDVLVVGAGLSGIGAACQLQRRCPDRSVAIVEARAASGGTWDLFRYPGVRSDSDMFTLGYGFRPWQGIKAITDGPSILAYLRDTAREQGIDTRIRYRHRVVRADWSTAEACWTVALEADGQRRQLRCNFLFLCAGYYRYDQGHRPAFAGEEDFAGRIVHPQHWPADLDGAGQRIVVIGSGATAMTLVPALAERAVHVTMLQRSPTWVISMPSVDPLARVLRRVLPQRWAHGIARWKQILLALYSFSLFRRRPALARKLLLAGVRAHGVSEADIAAHFTPRYNPWEQRLCLLPDADLFKALRSGRAGLATDTIERFVPEGVRLKSGATLPADVIVTATGLEMQVLGGIAVAVDGVAVDAARTLNYKGLMLGGVPNLATTFGYTNASWTLKSDLVAEYVCRLLLHMCQRGVRVCTPELGDALDDTDPFVDFSSGYVQRALDRLPRQGKRAPWKLNQNYLSDIRALRHARIDDGVLRFA